MSVSWKEVKNDPEKYLDIFSEESQSLKQLINFCIENDIITCGSCAGHKDENKRPFIGFVLNNENKDLFLRLLSLLNKGNVECDLLTSRKKLIAIRANDYNGKDLFKEILTILTSLIDSYIASEEYERIINYILDANSIYFEVKVSYKNGIPFYQIVTNDLTKIRELLESYEAFNYNNLYYFNLDGQQVQDIISEKNVKKISG